MAEFAEIREANPKSAYEQEDWPIGWVGLIYLATVLLLVIAPLVLWWIYPRATQDVSRELLAQPPAPALQTNAPQDLANFLRDQERKLNTYYWVDKQKGLVHIPIGEAMKKLAHDGIDGFAKVPQ